MRTVQLQWFNTFTLITGRRTWLTARTTTKFFPHRCIWRFRFPWNWIPTHGLKKLEWWGYWAEKEVWRYLQPSGYNTRTWQTDGRTDRQTDRHADGHRKASRGNKQTCRLPRVQNLVSRHTLPGSRHRPTNAFRFSWFISRIWSADEKQWRHHVIWLSDCLLH